MELLQLNEAFLQRRRAEEAFDAQERQTQRQDELRLLEEVRLILRQDAEEALEAFKELSPSLWRSKPRRNGLEKGEKPWKILGKSRKINAKQ